MRKSRKLIAILATLALLATLLVPMVGPAAASATYSMSSVNKVKAGFSGPIGNLTITMDASTALATVGKYVYFDLPTSPSGYVIFPNLNVGDAVQGVVMTNAFNAAGAAVTITKTSATQFKIEATVPGSGWDTDKNSLISIPLAITVPGGVAGDVKLTVSAPSSSTFAPGGDIIIARVGTTSGTIASESVPAISSSGGPIGVIDIKEDTAGSLADSGGTAALKLKLPPGFKWRQWPTVTTMWGNVQIKQSNMSLSDDDRQLNISVPSDCVSTSGSFIKLNAAIDVDESVAKVGVITVTVSGATSFNPSSIDVGMYGDYTVSAKAFSTLDLIGGKAGQDIGKLEIDESIPGSLVEGRTLTLTLPDNVKWAQLPIIDTDKSKNYRNITITTTVVGSDAKMIKITFNNCAAAGATDPATIVLKDMQVTPAIDFTGDLTVEMGGSQGISGNVTLGKVKAPVSVSASATPDVQIGLPSQAIGDITITENAPESIKGTVTYSVKNNDGTIGSETKSGSSGMLVVKAPAGVTFDGTPTVDVTEGDLQIDKSGVKTDTSDANEGLLYIKIKSSSTQPSTIKISGIKLTVDRTIPEGPLALKVRGTALDETLNIDGVDEFFPGRKDAASVVVAKCVTPAPVEKKSTVVFKIGDTKYTVNGVEQTMDAAPYIKDGRTFIPVRYAAQAVGVTPENILYSDGKVTLIKSDKVVQITIGSNVMLINGVAVTMDVPAEISSDRTMLPFRWVAQALGAQVNWDETNQAVTMTL
ncbi:MAG TPA: copper amine oxidase N-terminal domain-containing protein [Desulfotomaculum sp.]|nr:copper amine oxidase N-terminal domain-containing protein [Desulfotomaculum sp.]